MLTILRFFAPVLVHNLTDVIGASVCVIEASAIDFDDMKKEYGKWSADTRRYVARIEATDRHGGRKVRPS